MIRALRLLAVGLLLAGFLAPAMVSATEAETESTTTVAPDDPDAIVPAVEVPEVAEEPEEPPWTTRFLAPATLALGVLGVVGAVVLYRVRIGGRYRVN